MPQNQRLYTALWQKNVGNLLTPLGENKLLLGIHSGTETKHFSDKVADHMPNAGLTCSSKLSQMETAAAIGINI